MARVQPGWFNPGSSTCPPIEKQLWISLVCPAGWTVGVERACHGWRLRAAASQEKGTWLGKLPRRALRSIRMYQAEMFGLESRTGWLWGGGRGALGPHPYPLPRVQTNPSVTHFWAWQYGGKRQKTLLCHLLSV